MSLGFEQAGFDIVFAVDSDGHHVAVHRRNFPQYPTVCQSVTALTSEAIFQAIGGRQEIDLVFGGPPCQGFSSMGLRDVRDPRNSLVDHFTRLVADLHPKAFVMENVPGMATGSTKSVLDRAVAFLEARGYLIAKPVSVLDASHFGVPQKRRRLFMLGVRADIGVLPSYPSGTKSGQPHRPTVWEAIGDLPDVDKNERLFESDVTEFDRRPESEYAKVARGAVEDPTDFAYPRSWDREHCSSCLRIRHTAKAVELYGATPPGRTVPGHKLPRLDPEGICCTLRAGSDSTHGSYTAPRPIHPYRPRCITAREAARLHGFPDWFAFYPTKWHAYRQIGNAVCPPVARAVGFSILEALGIAPCKPKKLIALLDEFTLPDDRPRTLRRIPHVRNYPPVVQFLFSNAYHEKSERLWRAKFTFKDVREAIETTGVHLPWTRADTFVQEIARSRNVLQILEPCLKHGYSIAPLKGRFIGEFRPVEEPGSITEKDAIEVRSVDIASALLVETPTVLDLGNPLSLATLFQEKAVAESLWQEGLTVQFLTTSSAGNLVADFLLVNGTGSRAGGVMALLSHSTQPTKSRVRRLLHPLQEGEVVVAFPVTDEHVLAVRFQVKAGLLREVKRRAYRVNRPARGQEPTHRPAQRAGRRK
ncbi:MAG: DNA cytosine methyltransferase [Gemmataceae bacterium]|nr:DNA cytosine methyltransferase [Gemmataceae bacterium]